MEEELIPRCPQCDAETAYHKDVTGFGAYRVQYCGNGCVVDRIVEQINPLLRER